MSPLRKLSVTLLRYVAAAVLGSFVTAIAISVYLLNSRPDLSIWHLADLDEEYTEQSDITNFGQYLELEDRLFTQLEKLVYHQVPTGPEYTLNRYSRGSLADPARWPINWNRSFELKQPQPRAGILLLHGLSDSPYSMRALGEALHQQGAMVLGLRLPGHGTAPSGLVEIRWQDMAAAVRLAARHVQNAIGKRPLYIVGYSNGGALSVEYILRTLTDPSLPRPSGIVLLSPEIAVSPAAALAVWQGRLGHLLGLEKLAWNTLLPEYDPFKYGSFPVNAGDLAHRITIHLQQQLDALQGTGRLAELPPIIAFQSSVDATVTATALVENLFERLPSAGHELVLFDINRRLELDLLLKQDPRTVFEPLLTNNARSFDLTVVTNSAGDSNHVQAYTARSGASATDSIQLKEVWPKGVFSLSHVALPFPPTDAVYGGPDANESPGIQLGNLAMRGERNVMVVSGADILRLRWNPFYEYVQTRIIQFTGLENQ